MKLTKFSPWKEISTVGEQISDLFEDLFYDPFPRDVSRPELFVPYVDIEETRDALIVNAELPGIDVQDVDIKLEGDVLTIQGEKKSESKEKKKNYLRVERSYGSFKRSFVLGVPVKQNELKAKYKNGILTITLPKAEEVKEKSIKIEVETEK